MSLCALMSERPTFVASGRSCREVAPFEITHPTSQLVGRNMMPRVRSYRGSSLFSLSFSLSGATTLRDAMPSDIYRKRKIVIMGSRGAGKSSLAFRYAEDGLWTEAYLPTISNLFERTVKHEEQEYDLYIHDTAGQDEFSILNSHHIIGIHGFVLVYSVSSRASFENARLIWDKIVSFCGRPVPAVLVAQKVDLPRREVSEAQGRAMAQSMGTGIPYLEASAKEERGIADVFETCLVEIEKRYGRRSYRRQSPSPEPPPPARCTIM